MAFAGGRRGRSPAGRLPRFNSVRRLRFQHSTPFASLCSTVQSPVRRIARVNSIKARDFSIAFILACLSAGCNSAAPEPDAVVAKSFGERQLDQMLDDRPDMRDAIPRPRAVIPWLIEGFNGDRLGQRVYWNASSPQSGRAAEHGGAYGTYPPYIAVSGGTVWGRRVPC